MPRAASNWPARPNGPYDRSLAVPESHARTSIAAQGDRRESGFRALSRRISQVFSRAAGRPSDVPPAEPTLDGDAAEPEASSQMLGETSNDESQVSQASQLVRAPSASRQASVNLSILRRQQDMRVPAHLIVEAYRQALREKSEHAAHKRAASASSEQQKEEEREAPPRKAAKVERPSTASRIASNAARKPKSRPVKHKIQLVTKPVLDLGSLPDDRKKRPGFISANFDVSDDDLEPEPEPEPASAGAPESALLRRPQLASDKLQRALTEAPKPEPAGEPKSERAGVAQPAAAPAPASAGFSFGGLNPSTNAALSSDTSAPKSTAPKFSFGAGAGPSASVPSSSGLSDTSSAPKFSFGAGEPVAAPSSSGAPKFSFGATTTEADKPGDKSGDKSGEKKKETLSGKPMFSFAPAQSPEQPKPALGGAAARPAAIPAFNFGASTAHNKDAKPLGPAQSDAAAQAQKPTAFSFGSANGTAKPEGDAKPSFNFSVANDAQPAPPAKRTFDFGAQSDTAQVADKPATPLFGASTGASKPAEKPSFGFPASNGPSNPAEKRSFDFGATAGQSNSNPLDGGRSGEKPADAKPADAKPVFSFGSSATSDASAKPASVSFGAPAKPSDGAVIPKPSGLGLAADGDKQALGANAANGDGKLAGQPAGQPAFNFGAGAAEPAAKKPVFGSDKPVSTPFSFGASSSNDKPFQFGANNGSAAQPAAALPAAGSSGPTPKPVFGSGASAPQQPFSFTAGKPASPAPFGGAAASSAAPAFDFGAKQGTGSPASQPAPQPGFSFGANATGFGGAAPPAQPFTFGAPQPFAAAPSADSKATTPFSFGAPAAAGSEAPSAFAFGQPPAGAAAAGGANQFGSRESTPGASTSQQRKIAQVKRRLRR